MTTIYSIEQYDTSFRNHLETFGFFTNRKLAIKAMMDGFEKLYPGFKEEVWENGSNKWVSDAHDFGIVISEISVNNIFEEM